MRCSLRLAVHCAVFCAALSLHGGVGSAAAVTPQTAIDDGGFFASAVKQLARVPGFTCSFEQEMQFSDGGGQLYAGEVSVKKPRRFRWQYAKPYEQLYVGDGTAIWHYEPDLMQAERLSDLDQVDPAVMKLLDGRIGADQLAVLAHSSKAGVRLYQVSIEGGEPVWLGFDTAGSLVQIERDDLLGNRNLMRLSGCSYVAPSENLFSFTPPEGVDVLDMRSTGAL